MDNCSVLPHGYVLQGARQSYVIERPLGQGSFGITYLAKYKVRVTGQMGGGSGWLQVCVKEFFMRDMNSRDERTMALRDATGNSLVMKYRRAFMREASNLARMKHPGIVNVFEVIETNNTAYIVMEYIDGGSLDEYIAQRGRLPEKEALACFEPVCDAMCYMHAQRMLHLDMKPKNVMRDEEGHLYLIDFGLSKQYTESGEPESSTSIGLGTPGYAPLEQVEQRDDSKDFRTTLDVYALGATLFKMLTGQTPPTANEVNSVVLDGDNLIQSELRKAGVSAQVAKVVSTAMWPGAKKRYQTVPELMKALGWTAKTYQTETPSAQPKPKGQKASAAEEVTVTETPRQTSDEKTRVQSQQQSQPKQPKPQPQQPRKAEPKAQVGEEPVKKNHVKGLLTKAGIGLAALLLLLFLIGRCGGNSHTEEPIEEAVELPDSALMADSVASDASSETVVEVPEEPVVTEGSVKVSSTPSGAAIWVDGKSTKLTTNDVIEDLTTGSHKVKVELEGYESQTKTVSVKAGERAALSFTLKEVKAATAASSGISVNASTTSSESGASGSTQQPRKITAKGMVTDKDSGKPLVGTAIRLKNNQTKGAVTDANGKFELADVTEGDVIVFMYVGYKTEEVKASTNMKVVLNGGYVREGIEYFSESPSSSELAEWKSRNAVACAKKIKDKLSQYDVPESMVVKDPCLVYLILTSSSVTDIEERQSWFDLYDYMDQQQIDELYRVFYEEQYKLGKIDSEYKRK